HLTERRVGEFAPPLAEWPADGEPPSRPTELLRIGDRVFVPWQEAEERALRLAGLRLGNLLDRPQCRDFAFPGRRWLEPLPGAAGEIAGVLVREQQEVRGAIEVAAARVAAGLYRLTLRVRNRTPPGEGEALRDGALLRSL